MRAPSSRRARAIARDAPRSAPHAVDRRGLQRSATRPSIGAGRVLGADVDGRRGHADRSRASTLLDGVRIGARCIVHPGAVHRRRRIRFRARSTAHWQKIPQLGSVVIGDDVEIGANTTIDRGTIEDTVIEDGVKLDNLVQIAHNVRLGAHTIDGRDVGRSRAARRSASAV